MASKPHILIFNPDEWRGDALGHLGDPAAHTPNLDRFAREDAVSFRNAFCQNPVCVPSRCSFMTGRYPHTRGHRTMSHMLQSDEPMLLRTLKQNGYYVWWAGKNDVVPAQNGYDDFCHVRYKVPNANKQGNRQFFHYSQMKDRRGEPGSDNYYSMFFGRYGIPDGEPYLYDRDVCFIEGAIDIIHNPPVDENGELMPLCLYLALDYPHPPYGVEEPWYSIIDRDALPWIPPLEDWSGKPSLLAGLAERLNMSNWSAEQWRELKAVYYGMCSRIDWLFGQLIEALQQAGMYDDTAIFVFSDHGDYAGDYGLVEKTQNTFEDCLTHVPFLIKPPGGVPVMPRVSEALVELVDFPATVAELTGIELKETHFGRSLLPVVAGFTNIHRNMVFCQGGRIHGETQAMEHVDELTPERGGWPRLSLQHSEGPEHTKATMCRTHEYKYVHRLYEADELYDLKADPHELHNLVDRRELTEVRFWFMEQLLRFYLETSDVVPTKLDRRW